MFRALLVHPQEALHKRHLVYGKCVMSVDCDSIGVLCGYVKPRIIPNAIHNVIFM
jgi:hypothetical protein